MRIDLYADDTVMSHRVIQVSHKARDIFSFSVFVSLRQSDETER